RGRREPPLPELEGGRTGPGVGGGVPPGDRTGIDATELQRQAPRVADPPVQRAVLARGLRDRDRQPAVDTAQRHVAGGGRTARPGVDRPLQVVPIDAVAVRKRGGSALDGGGALERPGQRPVVLDDLAERRNRNGSRWSNGLTRERCSSERKRDEPR